MKPPIANAFTTLLASAARTATPTLADQANGGARGIHVIMDITVNAGSSASLTMTIQGKDPASGKYYTLLASAALSSVATTVYKVFPGSAVSGNVSANDSLPTVFRVIVTHADANPATYSLGYTLLP